MSQRAAALLLVVALALAWGAPEAPGAEPPGLRTTLGDLVQRGAVIVGEDGRVIYEQGRGDFVPASIIKLATALAAFHHLGAGYRFRTLVYRKGRRLYVRGAGDPFLVSEEWRRMAGQLAGRGVFRERLEALVLDGSRFAPGQKVDGAAASLNPYDARLGALVSNFNTVFVTVDAKGRVRSAEPQTPLTPISRGVGRTLSPGSHRVNLTARGVEGIRYSGELAQAIFSEAGARFSAPPLSGRVPPDAEAVLEFHSGRTLEQVVAGMMEFSNNYIANQLLMALALQAGKNPARLEDGVAVMRNFLARELELDPAHFDLREGSGLSPNNRIQPRAMLAIVDAFWPWRGLLKPYGPPPWPVPAKTGTLTGVQSLAGYLPAPSGMRRPFVIMLNQPRRTRARVFQHLLRAFSRGRRQG